MPSLPVLISLGLQLRLWIGCGRVVTGTEYAAVSDLAELPEVALGEQICSRLRLAAARRLRVTHEFYSSYLLNGDLYHVSCPFALPEM